jgi:ubiquinone/menaquinone biosynthesis C-methylase UbiE
MKKLNFGCGKGLKKCFENVDKKDFNFNKIPYPYKKNTFDYVLIRNVLEHLLFPWEVLREIHRICKKGARVKIISAHHNCEPSYNSLQHFHHFNEKAFKEFISRNNEIFEITQLKIKPTRLGKIFPSKFRDYLSRHLGHIKGEIICQFKVLK